MKADKYLQILTKHIENSKIRRDIMREYQDHIEDCKEALMESGMREAEAEDEAVRQMGDPDEAGSAMNQLYRDVLDLHMALWFLGCVIVLLLGRWALIEIEIDDMKELILNYVGGAVLIYGFILCAWEKHNDMGIAWVYGKNWSGGIGAMNNSGFILAVGVAFMAPSVERGVWIALAVAAVLIILRSYVQMLNNKREIELLWEIGVADTVINYKGKGTFCGKQMKIKTNEEDIQPETPIMIVFFEGAKPVVARV